MSGLQNIGTWNASYSVGNELLDGQHQELLMLCQRAANCLSENSDSARQNFHGILNDLANYARCHFRTEEAILERYNYPLLAEQKAEHLAYEENLTDFLVEATFGDFDREGLYRYLAHWWSHHILHSDMDYRDFLINAAA